MHGVEDRRSAIEIQDSVVRYAAEKNLNRFKNSDGYETKLNQKRTVVFVNVCFNYHKLLILIKFIKLFTTYYLYKCSKYTD